LLLGEPIQVPSKQSHKMAMVILPGSRVAVFFSETKRASGNAPGQLVGTALLVQLGSEGSVTPIGTYDLCDDPVVLLEALRVSPTSFVIAARVASVGTSSQHSSPQHEASVIYGEMIGNTLVFNHKFLSLEPTASQIGVRGLSLIAPNTVAYAYHVGTCNRIQMAVLEIDPMMRSMQLVSNSTVIHDSTPGYVSMLSVPFGPDDPHTLIYYGDQSMSKLNTCRWIQAKKQLVHCEDFTWLPKHLISASGARLGAGRALMVFAPESGVPHYAVINVKPPTEN